MICGDAKIKKNQNLLVVLILLPFLTQDIIPENTCSLKPLPSWAHLKLAEIGKIRSRKGGEPFPSSQKSSLLCLIFCNIFEERYDLYQATERACREYLKFTTAFLLLCEYEAKFKVTFDNKSSLCSQSSPLSLYCYRSHAN